jgi:cytoskeleton protein RodZ
MVLLRAAKSSPAEEEREPAARAPGADLIGIALRQRRQSLALDLSEVAAALRIKAAYLAALESGSPEQLPGPAYAVGFLRAYANYLGLDADEMLRRFKQNPAAFGRKPHLALPMALGERSIPGAGMLLVAAILAFCGYGTWYYLSTAERSRPERVAQVPAEFLAPKPGVPVEPPTEAWAATPFSAQDVPAPAEMPDVTAEPSAGAFPRSPATTGAAEAATRTASFAPVSAPRGPLVATGAPARIVLHAAADSWVEIRNAGRGVLLARVLKAGETYEVPDWSGLSMRTGNAGGLAITVDGNPTPSIGPIGAVRRNVVLEPEALSAGLAVRP